MHPNTDWTKYIERATTAQQDGKMDFAEATWFLALEEAVQFGDTDTSRLVFTLRGLARCLWSQGRLAEARQHLIRALNLAECLPEPEEVDGGAIAGDLANLYSQEDNALEAEAYYKRALAMTTKIHGARSNAATRLTDQFARFLEAQGRKDEAEQLRPSRSVKRYGSFSVHDLPAQAAPTASPSVISASQPGSGDTQELKSIPERGFASSRSGQLHFGPAQKVDLRKLSGVSWEDCIADIQSAIAEDDFERVERCWRSALSVAAREGKKTPRYCRALEGLADALCVNKKQMEASTYLEQAYQLRLEKLGEKNSAVAGAAGKLANVYYVLGEYAKAEKLALDSVKIYRETLGQNSAEHACALHNIATLYHSQKQYDRAEPYYQKSLYLKQQVYGNEHFETINLLRGYADLLRKTHREEQAQHLDECASGVLSGAWNKVKDPVENQP